MQAAIFFLQCNATVQNEVVTCLQHIVLTVLPQSSCLQSSLFRKTGKQGAY